MPLWNTLLKLVGVQSPHARHHQDTHRPSCATDQTPVLVFHELRRGTWSAPRHHTTHRDQTEILFPSRGRRLRHASREKGSAVSPPPREQGP